MRNYRRYPEYKDSGIEWLEEIPAHWEVRRLKCLATINDEVLPETTDPDFEISYVDIGSVDSTDGIVHRETYIFANAPSRARRIVRHGDVIVSTVRTYLRAIAPIVHPEPNLIVSTGFAVIRPRAGLATRFSAYALRSPYFVERVVAHSVGVSYPAVNASELGAFPIAVPSEVEQRAIADFLDRETAKIDALIEKKERLIELLKEKRTALISQAVTKGLDPNVPMKDSGIEWLGEIPAHWEVAPLKRWVIARPGAIKTGPFGSQLLSSEMQNGTVKVYNQRTVLDKNFASADNLISEEKYRSLAAFTVYPGDLLVTTRGTIGRCAIVPNNAERGILHPCLLRIQPDPKQIVVDFLSLLIQDSFLVQIQLALASNATTIDVIYGQTIGQVIIPRPPIIEQYRIVAWVKEKLEKLDRLINSVEKAIKLLKEYRTALISAAVTGEVDVREEVGQKIEVTKLIDGTTLS